MSLTRLRRKIFGRRSVRARIAVACAGLFLVIAAAFIAAIYTVVDRSFGPTPPPTPYRPAWSAPARRLKRITPSSSTQLC